MERPTPPSTPRSGTTLDSGSRPISVYTNCMGDIVIRQACSPFSDKTDDDVIVVRRESVAALTDAVAAELCLVQPWALDQ